MTAEPLRIAPSRHGGHWTIEDWKSLSFSTEDDWQTAIDIFEDRIRSRFLNIIDQAQSSLVSGFAVMALDCLLIETLQQFFEGKEETPSGQSGKYFRRFLTQTSFQTFFDEDMARMFFTQIRCGILHQAEIKGSSRIWIRTGMPLVTYAANCNGLLIHRQKFHDQLIYEFEHYVTLLRQNSPLNIDLRKKFKQKMDAICKVRILGILAYGSLLKNPDKELQKQIIERIPVETPFPVEYARSSSGRSDAPTLVPVPIGKGKAVNAYILVLRPNITEPEANNMLYRRELNKVGDKNVIYDDAKQRSRKNAIVIEKLKDFNNIPLVLYTSLESNISKVLDNNVSSADKASEIASLAISSVTKDTFSSRRDGIQYLSDAMCCGIETSLTQLYAEKILRRAGNSSNLTEARLWIARNNGL